MAEFSIMEDGLISMAFLRAILGEVIGTFFLIFLGCGGAYGMAPGDFLHVAFAFGIGIGGTVHLFSDISGGHLNPAVSLALFVARKCSLVRAALYVVAQFAGGFFGALIVWALCENTPGVTSLGANVSTAQGFFFEFFGTLFLVLTVLATTNSKRGFAGSYLQPLAIGLAIFVAHLVLIKVTQCGINPVRGIVINIIANQVKGYDWIYIIAPLLASVVGGGIYEFFFDTHYNSSNYTKEGKNSSEQETAA